MTESQIKFLMEYFGEKFHGDNCDLFETKINVKERL